MSLLISSVYTFDYDNDAATYIQAVEAVDEQRLELGTRQAINNFVLGCKADGIWSAIKASCVLAGARTLAGALVPLAGTAPTNVGPFVSGDYNRKTGLVGDGTSKYLNSNRNNNADPQNNNHNACWVSAPAVGSLMTSSSGNSGQNYMDITSIPSTRLSSRTSATNVSQVGAAGVGFYGHRRNLSSQISYRSPQGNGIASQTAQVSESRNIFLYTRSNDGITFSSPSAARLAFYSIGESLDLALLDARVTDLINAFAVTIP
jgi:hypothetical protein